MLFFLSTTKPQLLIYNYNNNSSCSSSHNHLVNCLIITYKYTDGNFCVQYFVITIALKDSFFFPSPLIHGFRKKDGADTVLLQWWREHGKCGSLPADLLWPIAQPGSDADSGILGPLSLRHSQHCQGLHYCGLQPRYINLTNVYRNCLVYFFVL